MTWWERPLILTPIHQYDLVGKAPNTVTIHQYDLVGKAPNTVIIHQYDLVRKAPNTGHHSPV